MAPSCSVSNSNLQRFLDHTTPVVPSCSVSKSCIGNSNGFLQRRDEEEVLEYFTLRELWDCYDEWSAYGAGVPVVIDEKETIVQYYVPYLSAIQIYIGSRTFSLIRNNTSEEDSGRDDSEAKDPIDSWSNESEVISCEESREKLVENALWCLNKKLGYIYFQYIESSAPYGRLPLMDKIRNFAKLFPGLMTLKSVDLSPASWMAVAWYPIYHIPASRTVRDVSTCFLTYHTLSSSFQEIGSQEVKEIEGIKRKQGKRVGIVLPPFGAASYKIQYDLWGEDLDHLQSLLSVADSWLKQLQVNHHDFNYFTKTPAH